MSQCSCSGLSHDLAMFSETPPAHPHFYLLFLNPETLFEDVSKPLDTNPLNQRAFLRLADIMINCMFDIWIYSSSGSYEVS